LGQTHSKYMLNNFITTV